MTFDAATLFDPTTSKLASALLSRIIPDRNIFLVDQGLCQGKWHVSTATDFLLLLAFVSVVMWPTIFSIFIPCLVLHNEFVVHGDVFIEYALEHVA